MTGKIQTHIVRSNECAPRMFQILLYCRMYFPSTRNCTTCSVNREVENSFYLFYSKAMLKRADIWSYSVQSLKLYYQSEQNRNILESMDVMWDLYEREKNYPFKCLPHRKNTFKQRRKEKCKTVKAFWYIKCLKNWLLVQELSVYDVLDSIQGSLLNSESSNNPLLQKNIVASQGGEDFVWLSILSRYYMTTSSSLLISSSKSTCDTTSERSQLKLSR